MQLREALEQIAEIRSRMAQSEVFRGYRAIPAALSGLLALLAGMLQPLIVPEPVNHLGLYVGFWIVVASISVLMVLLTIAVRDWLLGSSETRKLTWLALWQFVPGIFAGFAVTLIIARYAPEAGWLLPGLWQLFFSQGVFASCRFLPRAAYGVGGFYLLSGISTLLLAQQDAALSPLAMALPFGVGQFYSAGVLYWTLERHEQRETSTEPG
jgi:hypothetical protein